MSKRVCKMWVTWDHRPEACGLLKSELGGLFPLGGPVCSERDPGKCTYACVCLHTHTRTHTCLPPSPRQTCLGSTSPQQELEAPCPVLFSVEGVELRWGDRTEQSRSREAELLCSFYSRKWGLGGRVEGQGWEQERNRKPPHSLAFPLPSLAAHGARISMGTIKEAGAYQYYGPLHWLCLVVLLSAYQRQKLSLQEW